MTSFQFPTRLNKGQSNDDMEILVALSDTRQTSLSEVTLGPKNIVAWKYTKYQIARETLFSKENYVKC